MELIIISRRNRDTLNFSVKNLFLFLSSILATVLLFERPETDEEDEEDEDIVVVVDFGGLG